MLPSLVHLRAHAVGCPPPEEAAASEAPPAAPPAAPSAADFWANASDWSDSDEAPPHPAFSRVYPSQSGLRLLNWGLEPAAALELLRQFAALYAYQAGDSLSEMVADSYLGRPLAARLAREGLFYEIRALGALRALVFLCEPERRALLGPLLPAELAARLGNEAAPLQERAALAEAALLLLLGGPGARRLKKRALEEWDAPGDRALAQRAAAQLREAALGPGREQPRPDARALLDFVLGGLRDAFANPRLLTPLPAGLVLYHGGGILDQNGRRNQHFKDKRDGVALTVFERSFAEEVQDLARGPVSASTDPSIALRFYRSGGYGSIFCIEIEGPVSAIVYSTLDRGGPLWDGKPEEREVLLPPGLEYELVPGEFCDTRPRLGVRVYRVRARQPPAQVAQPPI